MPLLELTRRELRLLLSSTSLWLILLAAGPLAGLALRRATAASWLADAVLVEVMTAATVTTMLGLPFVIARVASDHATARALVQLGHRPITLVLARALALGAALVLTLAPPLLAVVAWSVVGDVQVDGGALATLVLGHLCVGVAVIGIGLLAGALTASPSGAALLTLAVTAGAWTLQTRHAPGSFALPTAALGVFERGLIDARDVVSLVGGGAGLALASAALQSLTVPLEQRAVRCAGALLVTALLCGASSQLRLSFDITGAQQASLASPFVTALARIGDPVTATVHMGRDDARAEALERDVLLPLRRQLRLRVRFAPHTATAARPAGGASLVTWRVGAREQTSDALTAERAVPIVLELAGVEVPPVLPRAAPARHEGGAPPLALLLLLLLWPLLALVGVWRSRRGSRPGPATRDAAARDAALRGPSER